MGYLSLIAPGLAKGERHKLENTMNFDAPAANSAGAAWYCKPAVNACAVARSHLRK